MNQGVIVGCDANQENLLLFFWLNYRLHNAFPITFMDFGMSSQAKAWCQERGLVIPIEETLLANPHQLFEGQTTYRLSLAEHRLAWFKKPLAFSKSPYDKTLWLDLDCLVRGNLSSLFKAFNPKEGFYMMKEPKESLIAFRKEGIPLPSDSLYNSGVVLFCKKHFLIEKWIEACKETPSARGDQEVLTSLFEKHLFTPKSLNWRYNWLFGAKKSLHKKAHILHFTGEVGKYNYKLLCNTLLDVLNQSE